MIDARRKKHLYVGFTFLFAVVIIIACVILYYKDSLDDITPRRFPDDPEEEPGPSDTIMGNYRRAAVVSNSEECPKIGKDILLEGGNAVDAAIATLLCEGLTCAQSMGVGGGFLMTIYNRTTRTAYSLNARETAPLAATEDMYHGNSNLSQKGGLAVAVPGELLGYEEAHKRFGVLPWTRLFQPTIRMCRDGFPVNSYLAAKMKGAEEEIRKNPALSAILINPVTNQTYQIGEIMKRPQLGHTLQLIAEQGTAALYNGTLTDVFVKDVQDLNGIITRQDMEAYTVQWQTPLTTTFHSHTVYTAPLPGTGAILTFILNLLDGFLPGDTQVVSYQRIIEAFKWGYGRRTHLGDYSSPGFVPDPVELEQLMKNLTSKSYAEEIRRKISDTETHQDPEFYGAEVANNEDHGTAQLNVIDAEGNAVSVTSTVNFYFGAKIASPNTGIILNNEMDDFSAPNITNGFDLPPSPANFIRPGKRPLSSMVPTIFVDSQGDVQLVIGAAGGSRITSATALISILNLVFKNNIKQAVDHMRVHHQLFPMKIFYENGTIASVVRGLQDIGHITERGTAETSITGIARLNGNITAAYDFRRTGASEGY